jgi:invasion protein IalB
VVAAVVIEPEGETKHILRITVPLDVRLAYGTRIGVDNGEPQQSPYVICFASGCLSDYDATPELISKLKAGQTLIVQAIRGDGTTVTRWLTLREGGGAGFTRAIEGPRPIPSSMSKNNNGSGRSSGRDEQARQVAPPPKSVFVHCISRT